MAVNTIDKLQFLLFICFSTNILFDAPIQTIIDVY